MNYTQIRSMDISNGEGIGCSLFVSGCPIPCKGCFTSAAWDFNSGKLFTGEVESNFIDLCKKPYIHRISILGGEPFSSGNVTDVSALVEHLRTQFPDKIIWMYSGYTLEVLTQRESCKKILSNINVLVDGPFIEEQKDLSLSFRGSKNQRIIDVQQSLYNNSVILFK